MRRGHQEVAASGKVFLTIGRDPEPEPDEEDEAGDEADQPIEDRGGRLRRPPEPGEALRARRPEPPRAPRARRGPAVGGAGSPRRRRTVGLVRPQMDAASRIERLVSSRPARAGSRPGAPQVVPSGWDGGSSSESRDRWRLASTATAGTMNRSDTIWAIGTPKKVQLSCRKVSSAKRTTPYQMKKVRARSPGRSRSRNRKPSQIRKARRGRRTATRTGRAAGSAGRGWPSGRKGSARVVDDPMGALDGMPHGRWSAARRAPG